MQKNNRSRAGEPKIPSVIAKKDNGAGRAKCLPGPGNYGVDKGQVNEGESEVFSNKHVHHTHVGALGEE